MPTKRYLVTLTAEERAELDPQPPRGRAGRLVRVPGEENDVGADKSQGDQQDAQDEQRRVGARLPLVSKRGPVDSHVGADQVAELGVLSRVEIDSVMAACVERA